MDSFIMKGHIEDHARGKKRLRDADTAKFVEVVVEPSAEVAQRCSAQGNAIKVRLQKGRSVMVEPGFDANHLRALLAVLEREA
jgi:predicted ATP-dependent serine protease